MVTTSTAKKVDTNSWICAFLLFIISCPKWVWGFGTDILTFASLLLLAFAYKDIKYNKRDRLSGYIALFLQVILVCEALISSNTNVNGRIMVLISGVGFASIFLCSAEFWKRCVDCFIKLLAILLLFALIEHIEISFFNRGLITSRYTVCPINVNRNYNEYLFNVYLSNAFGFFNRFYAFYDEPGVVGNIMMCLLYINKFEMKKWYNVVFLISGILSFSLAFYVAVIVFFIVFGNLKQKVAFTIVATIAYYYFYTNEYIFEYIFVRLEVQNGQLTGYNRDNDDFRLWIEKIPIIKYLFWGYRPRNSIPDAASWRWAFALYGIIPSVFYILSIVIPRVKYINKSDILRGAILVIIIWIQRPFVFLFLYAFLIAIPFIYSMSNVNQSIENE